MAPKIKAYIVLQDGTVLEGYSFGAKGTTIGEIVFNTSMTGYQEILTDPSYCGQIVMQTYPLIGNYGINRQDVESRTTWVKGYIVREWCEVPSNFRSTEDMNEYIEGNDIIGIYGIDTRALTRKIRNCGVMNGAITTDYDPSQKEALVEKINAYQIVNPVETVTTRQILEKPTELYGLTEEEREESGKQIPHVVLMDFGHKRNMVNEFISRGCDITVVPASTSAEEVLSMNPDGVMLSNGPGDPKENVSIIKEVRKIVDSGMDVFGVCLGHQILALAMGADTKKMKFGHRGANIPVTDVNKDKTVITTQNHGYVVDDNFLDGIGAEITHVNTNDKTIEGLSYKGTKASSVQFHPEYFDALLDSSYLYGDFIDRIRKER